VSEDRNFKPYIVFDTKTFTKASSKPDENKAQAVLGIIRASDEVHAQDTAATHFWEKEVFVRPMEGAEKEYAAAAQKIGYLNTSEAHHP
jgi:hypothetical protein